MYLPITEKQLIARLEDGLILRRSTPDDADALAEFNGRIHSDDGPEHPDGKVAAWTMDLLTRPHPTFDPCDFTIVEEEATGNIVSSLTIIPQTWLFAGIPFKVGRPELVGTLPEFRKRGLVRRQFEVIHQWSAERGELVQAITGIPFYYRLFGYEMAMNLSGGRMGFPALVPDLKEGESEPYTIRVAQPDDLPFISELDQRGASRSLVSVRRDTATWRYELDGRSENNVHRYCLNIIQSPASEPIGFIAHPPFNWWNGRLFAIVAFEIAAGHSWAAVTPSVLRYMLSVGQQQAKEAGKDAFGMLGLWLGEQHPVYQVAPQRVPQLKKPYAWYLRVPDLPGFLRHIRPALESRLASSPFAGHTATLRLTFYRDGLRMKIERGKLATIESWTPEPQGHSGDAAFPGLTFLQLLFGYRSTEELAYAFADCWYETDEIERLLYHLFPRLPSDLWPVS